MMIVSKQYLKYIGDIMHINKDYKHYKEFCEIFHELYLEAFKIKKIVKELETKAEVLYNEKIIELKKAA